MGLLNRIGRGFANILHPLGMEKNSLEFVKQLATDKGLGFLETRRLGKIVNDALNGSDKVKGMLESAINGNEQARQFLTDFTKNNIFKLAQQGGFKGTRNELISKAVNNYGGKKQNLNNFNKLFTKNNLNTRERKARDNILGIKPSESPADAKRKAKEANLQFYLDTSNRAMNNISRTVAPENQIAGDEARRRVYERLSPEDQARYRAGEKAFKEAKVKLEPGEHVSTSLMATVQQQSEMQEQRYRIGLDRFNNMTDTETAEFNKQWGHLTGDELEKTKINHGLSLALGDKNGLISSAKIEDQVAFRAELEKDMFVPDKDGNFVKDDNGNFVKADNGNFKFTGLSLDEFKLIKADIDNEASEYKLAREYVKDAKTSGVEAADRKLAQQKVAESYKGEKSYDIFQKLTKGEEGLTENEAILEMYHSGDPAQRDFAERYMKAGDTSATKLEGEMNFQDASGNNVVSNLDEFMSETDNDMINTSALEAALKRANKDSVDSATSNYTVQRTQKSINEQLRKIKEDTSLTDEEKLYAGIRAKKEAIQNTLKEGSTTSDWIFGNEYHKTAIGAAAMMGAWGMAFGGSKSNAELYSSPF